MVPRHRLRDRFLTWRRSFADPLRNATSAARWVATLPAGDALQLQREALDLIASFPGTRRAIAPAQTEALMRLAARFEPIIAQLTAQYYAIYQRSSDVETRLWKGVLDHVRSFTAAYESVLMSG